MRLRTLFVLALVTSIVACREKPEKAAEPAAAPATVTVAPARRGDVDEVLRVTGETTALKVLRLASPVAGRVTFLSANVGDRLAAGTTAARLLPLESEAAVNGFRVLERARALRPAERGEARKLERDETARTVSLAAPFAAIVGERVRNPGEQVAAGDVVLELFDPLSLVVIAQVPLEAAAKLHKGLTVTVHTATATVHGEIDAVLPSLAPPALTVPVRVALSSALDPPLRNAAVDCEIVLGTHRGALLIPHTALVASDSPARARVMVAEHDRAHVRAIETGIRSGELIEVRSGLEAGEPVLVEGQYGLADDAPIRVAAPDNAPPQPKDE